MLFFTVSAFALSQEIPAEGVTATYLVQLVTPLLTLGVTYLVRLAVPYIPAWTTILVVAGLSTAVAWISTLMDGAASMSFIEQTLYGLLAVVINQTYRAFTGGNKNYSREK